MRARTALPLIVTTAVALRALWSLAQGDRVLPLPGIFDQLSYHELATRVAGGHGFSFAEGHWPATRAGEPTAHWSYLYTVFLSALYWIAGVHPLVPRLVQSVAVGVLHPWLTYEVARQAFGTRVAAVSAALTAVYGYFVYYSGALLTESFYFVAVLWVLVEALSLAGASRRGELRMRHWMALGLAIGTATLLRQVFVFSVPVVLGWAWVRLGERPSLPGRRVPPGDALRGLAVTVATVAVLIAPWTIRNYRAFGSFVPLNTNAGFAFYWGNHPVHGDWFQPLLRADAPGYGALIPADLRALNEADLDRALLVRAMANVTADPVRFVRLSLSRTVEFVRFWPSSDSSVLSNLVRALSFGLALPLGLYGGLRWVVRGRRAAAADERAAVSLLCGWAAVYAGVHLASWTLIRYRLPIDAVLLPFAAFGLVHLAEHFTPRAGREAT